MQTDSIHRFGGGSETEQAPDKAVLGGKGAGLAAMSAAGLPVPPGFTIAVACCPRFLESGQWPAGLRDDVGEALAWLEQVTGRTLGGRPQPLLVSVRSGAPVSMPGMMDTILNCGLNPEMAGAGFAGFWQAYARFVATVCRCVAGLPDRDLQTERAAVAAERGVGGAAFDEAGFRQLAERYVKLYEAGAGRAFPAEPRRMLDACIEAVWRSWNSERAVVYRRQHDIRGVAGTAVTVQAMFPSEVAGVVFTVDPNAPETNEMLIEASYGLGESVVSGDVAPDAFRVDRASGKVSRSQLGRKTGSWRSLGDGTPHEPGRYCLTPDQVARLAQLALRTESLSGERMDVEFGFAQGGFALLQARPIRGLDVALDVEPARRDELARLQRLAENRRRVWVRHNLAETLPAPTPLTWDIVSEFMSGNGGYGLMYRDLGYRPSRRFCRDGFLELIGGRIYADPERARELFWEGMPLVYDPAALRQDAARLESPPTVFDADRAGGTFLLRVPGTLWRMARSARRMRDRRATAAARFRNTVLPPYLDYVKACAGVTLDALSTEAVLAELHARRRAVLTDFGKESLRPGYFGGMALASLEKNLKLLLGARRGRELAMSLIMGLDGDITVEQNRCLYGVARGETTMDTFLARYGHRAVHEMELAEPRWREDRSYPEAMAAAWRTAAGWPLTKVHEEHVAERRGAERGLPALLKEHGGMFLEDEICRDLREAQTLLPYREIGKHYLMMGYELIRRAILELGRRWELWRDVFFLRLDELGRFEQDRNRLQDELAARRVRWQAVRRLELPDVIDSGDWASFGRPAEFQAAAELAGVPVSAGVHTGPARVVLDPRQACDTGTGYVLVCPSTDPGWTALFVRAGALVMERGGTLSHGAIVARDFGLPAVVCPGATKRIADGAVVRVDGNRGTVSLL
ncbi:MAG: hypothetical protein JXR37_32845 [Kiritimatiellae bacterium]|nr:hypothetical protein [Kiritimatiellia bacterium]